MKKMLVLVLLLFSFSLSAQNFQDRWESVKKLESNGKSASALQKIKSIYQDAQEAEKEVQLVKAFLYKAKYELLLKEGAQKEVYREFRKAIAEQETPVQQILASVLAESLKKYYRENRYKIRDRTETDSTSQDFKTWTTSDFKTEIRALQELSISHKKQLLALPQEKFTEILTYGENYGAFRSTLYDLLINRYLEQLDNTYYESEANFWLRGPRYFSMPEKFSTLKLPAQPKSSAQLKSLKLYQELGRAHKNDKLSRFFVVLERLKFVHENWEGVQEVADSLYLKSLYHLKTHFISDFQHRWIAYKIAVFYHQRADKKQHPDYELKALEQVRNVQIHSEKENNVQQLALGLKKQILNKRLRIAAEPLAAPNQQSKARIEFKNLDSIYLSFYRIESWIYSSNGNYDTEDRKDFIKTNVPLQTQKIDLPDKKNHLSYSTEVLLPAFDSGRYLVVASPTKNVNVNNTQYSTSHYRVSRLSVRTFEKEGQTRFLVTDRISGKPIVGAKIEIEKHDQILTTNKNGIADLKDYEPKDDYNYNIKASIKHKKDHLHFYFDLDYRVEVKKNKDKKPLYLSTKLFSDRAIYRPGQPFYFKGIVGVFSEDGSFRKTIEDFQVMMKLYNANDILIDSMALTTNEFGSVHGKFILPENGLTGTFRLEMQGNFSATPQKAKQFAKENSYLKRVKNTHIEPSISFRVEEYKRPKFEVTFDKIDSTYILNDSVILSGQAEAFFGGNIANRNVRFTVVRRVPYRYGWRYNVRTEPMQILSDTTRTDSKGKFKIRFKAIPDSSVSKKTKPVFLYKVKATVTDVNGETHSDHQIIKVGFHATELSFVMPRKVSIGKNQILWLKARDLNGLKSSARGTLKIYRLKSPKRILKNRELKLPDIQSIPREKFIELFPHQVYSRKKNQEEKILVKTIRINTKEKDSLKLDQWGNLKSGDYLLQFKGKGERGFKLKKKEEFKLVNPQKPQQSLDDFLVWNHRVLPEKDQVKFTYHTMDSIYVYWELAYSDKLQKEKTFWLPPGTTEKRISIPPKTKKVNLRVSYVKHGFIGQKHKEIAVPFEKEPKRQLQLEVVHFENKIKPGSPQTWKLKVENKNGDPLNAEILASMYDASLDQFVPHQWSADLFSPNQYDYNNGLPSSDYATGGPSYPRTSVFNEENFYSGYSIKATYTGLKKFGYDFVDTEYSQKNYLTQLYLQKPDEKGFTGRISGIVTNVSGLPLPGVNIRILGTNRGTQTDFNGSYSLRVDEKSDRLVFKYVGYKTKKVTVGDRSRLNVVLNQSAEELHEVVITRYKSGIKKKDMAHGLAIVSSGAVTTISAEEIAFRNNNSNTITLRGVGSLNGNIEPLFIVNGEPVSASEFKKLKEGNIQSINVLKDEKATSIYGNRGTNGVIVITTKKAQAKLNKIEPRKDLKETAFFFPTLHTDENGNVLIEFTGPEALTRWKFQAFAHDKKLYQDYISLQSVTQKNLNLIPNFPRFFRSTDEVVISAKINNMSREKINGIAQLKFTNAYTEEEIDLVQDKVIKNFVVDGKANAEVSWKLEIPQSLGAVRYTISAKAGNFTDAQTDILPVLSNRLFITESFPFWIRPGQEKTLVFSALKNNDSESLAHHSLIFEYTAHPVWTALRSLPYLIEYPYECSEQTFARFFGNQLAFHLVNQNPKIEQVLKKWASQKTIETPLKKNDKLKSAALSETPWVKTALNQEQQQKQLAELLSPEHARKKAASTLRKLAQMQLDSGGFPWFTGGRANPFISLHIYTGFARMKHLGISLQKNSSYQKIIKDLNQYLTSHYKDIAVEGEEIQPEKLSPNMLQFFYAKNYLGIQSKESSLNKIKKAVIEKFNAKWLQLSLKNQLLLAMADHQSANSKMAKKILTALEEQAVINSDDGMYWKEYSSGPAWNQNPIATQTLAIEAFAEIQENNNTADRLKEWLLRQKQLQAWGNTKATTHAIYALLLGGKNWKSSSEKTKISIGDRKISFEGAAAKTGYVRKTFEKEEITPEMAEIEIKNPTQSPQYGAMYWQYFEDADQVKSSDLEELSIEKKWFIKVQTPDGAKLVPLNKRQPKVGDLLTVRIIIKAHENFEFMHLKDLRPAGLEPIDVLSKYKYQDGLGYYQSTKDVATHFFFDNLPKGTYVFEYDLRVNNAGDFTGGITTLQSMYAPGFSVRSEGRRLEVEN